MGHVDRSGSWRATHVSARPPAQAVSARNVAVVRGLDIVDRARSGLRAAHSVASPAGHVERAGADRAAGRFAEPAERAPSSVLGASAVVRSHAGEARAGQGASR